jgi:hypothetical protein
MLLQLAGGTQFRRQWRFIVRLSIRVNALEVARSTTQGRGSDVIIVKQEGAVVVELEVRHDSLKGGKRSKPPCRHVPETAKLPRQLEKGQCHPRPHPLDAQKLELEIRLRDQKSRPNDPCQSSAQFPGSYSTNGLAPGDLTGQPVVISLMPAGADEPHHQADISALRDHSIGSRGRPQSK